MEVYASASEERFVFYTCKSQANRPLLHDLPALAAAVIQGWVKLVYRARVLLLMMPHTFGAHLNFNCHLHILASAGGLRRDCF